MAKLNELGQENTVIQFGITSSLNIVLVVKNAGVVLSVCSFSLEGK